MSPLLGRPSLEGPHLVGRAVLLLVALLLAAAPVSQLLVGPAWLVLTLTGAAPVILGGVLLRRFLSRPLLVPLAQVGVIIALLLVVQVVLRVPGERGGSGPLRGQIQVFSEGISELAAGVAPVALDGPGTVVVIALVALMALVLDLMFLDLGWHTPTGLLLLAALLVPALQQPAGGPGWTIVGPVLACGLIIATRTVHGDPHYLDGDRRPQAGPLPRPTRTLTVAAVTVALVAGLTPVLAPALPQLAPPRIALTMDLLTRWQGAGAPSLGPVMIDDDVSVRRSLLEQRDVEVLTYTSSAEDPSYLRLRSLTRFDGEAFREADDEPLAMGMPAFSDVRTDGEPVTGDDEDLIDTDITLTNLTGDRLPVPANVRSVRAADAAVNRAMQPQPSDSEIATDWVRGGMVGQMYSVTSEPSTATADQLRGVDPAVFEQPLEAGYISVDDVPQVAADLAEELAAEAESDTAYDTALAYQRFFRSSFAYSLSVTTPPGEDPMESFLSDRIGYCEQFAAAFALMMTSQGYPARVAIGFTAGQQDGEEWSVRGTNAHAWPEVWFGPDHGWVRFEPTPAAAANGVESPARAEADTPDAGADDAVETPPTGEEAAPDTPEDAPETPETTAGQQQGSGSVADGGDASSAQTANRLGSGLVVTLALAALLAGLAAGAVLVIRRRRLRAREERWAQAGLRGDAGGGAGATLAAERMHRRAGDLAWSEVLRELTVRDRAIRWLGPTGAWGHPPKRLHLDRALPPQRALADLLDQIDAGTLTVTEEHRAAADRIAEAHIAATYAAPLPEEGAAGSGAAEAGAAALSEDDAAEDGGPATPHPLRHDADQLIELIRTAR